MKLGTSLVLLLAAVVGCENAQSRLDDVTKSAPIQAPGPTQQPGVQPPVAADHSGDVETRLRRLEDNYAKHAEALDFLGKVYAQQKAQQAAKEADEHDPAAVFAVAIADDVKLGKVDGPASAPVTIVKAFDFACPYCQRVNDTMKELVKEYDGKVRVVYADLVVHPDTATTAHLLACAAAKQGKYMAMKDAIWTKGFLPYAQSRDPSKLGKENLLAAAKEIGLDTAKLEADASGGECQQAIQADMAELGKFKVNSTPTFFVNGIHVGGALPKAAFKQLIDERLAVVEKSGVSGADYYEQEVLGKGVKAFRSKADATKQ
ncbi:MAG: thioredoxin domain-containing protein [Myxococcales bacterium]|nr:thioredoxin domain-containing protein [Myxococcales bacterium]